MLVVAFCCFFVVCAIMSIMDICSNAPCSSKLAVRIPSRRTLLFPSFSQSSLKSSFESWYISVPESVHLSSVVCLDAFMKSLYFTSTATVFAICFPFRSLPATFSDSWSRIFSISSILSRSYGNVMELPTPFSSSRLVFTTLLSIPLAYSQSIFPCFFRCASKIYSGLVASWPILYIPSLCNVFTLDLPAI